MRVCICEKKRLNEDIRCICGKQDIIIHAVNSKAELNNTLLQCDLKYFIMYEFGIIIPKEIFKQKKMRIFNFHPGSLLTNRGANPIVWSVLHDEKYANMTVYVVNEQVDAGEIISQRIYEINENDDVITLKNKMERGIASQLEALYQYIQEGVVEETKGILKRKICERDYTLDLKNDDLRKIQTKIQSQASYNGAVLLLEDTKFFVKDMKNTGNQFKVVGIGRDKIHVEKIESFDLLLI
ncbi:MAG: hypothetical protein HFH24_05520 [Ruminococcus sp.]|nr:hypothetical protein [Ruminococcus sp.]